MAVAILSQLHLLNGSSLPATRCAARTCKWWEALCRKVHAVTQSTVTLFAERHRAPDGRAGTLGPARSLHRLDQKSSSVECPAGSNAGISKEVYRSDGKCPFLTARMMA